MKNFSFRFLFASIAALSLGHIARAARGGSPTVSYNPVTEIAENGASIVEASQFSYTLTITTPSDIPSTYTGSLTINPTTLADPATGLNNPTGVTFTPALNYLSLSSGSVTGAPGQPITVQFTGGSTVISVVVTLNYPLGAEAGDYAYFLSCSGWPSENGVAGQDNGATINATVVPPPPTLQITSMTSPITLAAFSSTSNPVFQVASGQTTAPVTYAFTGGTPALTILSATAQLENSEGQVTTLTHTLQTITVTSTQAVTLQGLNESTTPFTVADANGNQYELLDTTSLSAGDALPLAFQAVNFGAISSAAGKITTLVTTGLTGVTVTNTGGPDTLGQALNGLNTASISGGATLNLPADTYTLTVTDANSLVPLQEVTQQVTFTVSPPQTELDASPAVTLTVTDPNNAANTITAPSDGSAAITLTIPSGQSSVSVPYSFIGSTSGGTLLNDITTVLVTLNGTALTPTMAGILPLNPADGNGTLASLTPGTYTLVVTDYNVVIGLLGGGGAQATITLTVQENATPAVSLKVTDPNNSANTVTAASGATSAITLTIPAGQTSVALPYTFVGSTANGNNLTTITSAGITLGGTALTPSSLTALPANPATGTGATTALSVGSYVLVASASNGNGSASATVDVTVQQDATPAVSLKVTDPNNASNVATAASGGSAAITLTIPAGKTSVAIPYTFIGSTSGGTVLNTITSAGIALGGTALTPSSLTALPASSATGAGSTTSLSVGSYVLVATASNGAAASGGSSVSATINITVQQAAAPAITLKVTDPNSATNTVTAASGGSAAITLTIPAGQTSVTLPYSFTGSTSGGTTLNTITSAGITLGGAALTPSSLTALPASSATGAGSTTSLSVGSYVLVATASNGAAASGGSSVSATVNVTVQQAAVPAVTLSVTDPNSSANTVTAASGGSATITLTIPAGKTSVAIPYTFIGSTSGGTALNTITSAGITLGGAALTPSSLTTLPANPATGIGSTAALGTGSYVLVASASNGVGSATATVNVKVQQAAAPAITLTVTDPNSSSNTVTAASGGSAALTLAIPSGQSSVTVPYSFLGTTSGATGSVLTTITSAGTTLGGTALTPSSLTTLPANPVNGSGTTASLAAGTYTLVATDSNGPASSGGGSASATVTITVASGSCSAPTVSVTSNFTGTSCQSNTIWFSSVVNVSGLSAQGGIIQFNNSTITFTANGKLLTLIAPSATITFSPTVTQATSTYNASSNTWTTTAPVGYSGNVFLSGLSYPVPSGFNASKNTVTWSGSFLGSTQNLSLQWLTSATLLSQCSSSYGSLGVKPVDSGGSCQYKNTDCAGTPESYRTCQNGSACTTGATGSNTGTTAITGLYATGLSTTGSLLAGGASDANYVVTASTLGSKYVGNAYVDPAPLAGGWVANSSKAQWVTAPGGVNIGNGAGNNGLPSSGSTAQTDTYDYTLTFSMPAGANLSTASITGTLSADDSVMVLVNGVQVTSGVPNVTDYEYNNTVSFTLNAKNASFQQGVNTITFRVANENTPTPANASGLYVQSMSGTVSAYQTGIAVTYCASLGSQSTASTGTPPTVVATNPTSGGTYAFASGSSVSVPVGFTATCASGSGNISAVSATLNGNPLSLTTTSGVGSSASAAGSATLTISTAGTYTLVYYGTDAYGSGNTTVTFTAVQVQPPTMTITSPASGSTFIIPAGSSAIVVPYGFTGGTTYATIQSASVTLNGAAISTSPTITGLNTASITGSGSLTLTAGTYTLGAVDSNGVSTGSDQNTFTVIQGQNSSGCGQSGGNSCNENLVWLQPNNFYGVCSYSYQTGCYQTASGGSAVPLCFSLYSGAGSPYSFWSSNTSNYWSSSWDNCWINSEVSNGNFTCVTDTSVVIAVYAVYSNNTSSAPVLYTYSSNGASSTCYSIKNSQYQLNLPTSSGTNHYQVEVYSVSNGLTELGCQDIYTH